MLLLSNTLNTEKTMSETTERKYPIPMIQVHLQPEEKVFQLERPKTARQLLEKLGLREETALVVRQNQLLTPDVRIYGGDEILVRKVTSSG